MKPIYATFIAMLISSIAYCQISTSKAAAPVSTHGTTPYDSSKNYLGPDAYQYIGQEVFFYENKSTKDDGGYMHFYTKPNVKISNEEYKYKPVGYDDLADYNEIVNKYFKVLDIIVADKEFSYYEGYYLKMVEKVSNDTVYYFYESKSASEILPFIVVGYYEKAKKELVGAKFLCVADRFKIEHDYVTGKPIVNNEAGIWVCKDIIVSRIGELDLVLEDTKGQTVLYDKRSMVGKNRFKGVFMADEAARYKAKFGVTNWNRILEGEVAIGMTKEMCRLSWGEPDDINETITANTKREQWVYRYSGYLYFTNGKLTAMQ